MEGGGLLIKHNRTVQNVAEMRPYHYQKTRLYRRRRKYAKCQHSSDRNDQVGMGTPGEEKRISRKMMNMVVPGKRRMGRPRRRGVDNNREDMKNVNWQLTWLETDSTGKWWWSLTHEDVEMEIVCKGEKEMWRWRWSLKARKKRPHTCMHIVMMAFSFIIQ